MGYNAAPLEKLIEEFSKFPGIGRKGATRMAYQVGSGCRRTGGCDPERPHQAPPLPCLPELYRSRALPHLCQCQAGPLCHLCGGNAP